MVNEVKYVDQCLNIVEGNSKIAFVKNEDLSNDKLWVSEEHRVVSGNLPILCDYIKLQISVHLENHLTTIMQCTFVLSTGSSKFVVTRLLEFKNGLFYRFAI